ncbi:hypothetical protein LC613_08760 [Nostoc sphaeroides CHAB 2801]|uniref:Regulator of protease activity HflC n=1 Tax=Nostoc sphaeroides CCNUC1 TaxID=2653204 RepID=A0A5P8VSN7_9NOSO|nr:hypothetical protein [Nostoc sphaeroides]MCC5628203.1 hypothetical protein [Nostoc sphaeroides CHAB 2801]QFS43357.1 Regulator of protease activity HflC [Nostoc sphaeroides CCNUC1]
MRKEGDLSENLQRVFLFVLFPMPNPFMLNLERIAEKIDRIQVNDSLDSIFTDLIRMN